MQNKHEELTKRLLGRQPTEREYRRVNTMLLSLPVELRESTAFMAELILRNDFLSSMEDQVGRIEEAIEKANFESVQKLDRDLPARVDRAAIHALNTVRKYMPMDGRDALRKALKIALLAFVVVAGMSSTLGFYLGHQATMSHYSPGNAYMDDELAQCVDAAAGAFANSARNGQRHGFEPADIVRDDLRKCGARYADRRAML